MSDEDEEFLEDEDETAAFPWSKTRTMYLIAQFAADLQRCTATFFENVAEQAGADHNQKVDAEVFRQEAAKQIETIFQEPETTDG